MLVSLVQTKYLPSSDTLFLPGSLTTGRRTHHAHSSLKKEACYKHTTEEKTVTQRAFSLVRRHAHANINISVYVCVHGIEEFKLDPDWHSTLSVNIPVMLHCLDHCRWATNQNKFCRPRHLRFILLTETSCVWLKCVEFIEPLQFLQIPQERHWIVIS